MSTSVWYCEHWRRTRHLRDTDLDASVLDACTALEGQNPCGPVSDGAILLSGFHCDAELTISKGGMNGRFDFGHAEVPTVSSKTFITRTWTKCPSNQAPTWTRAVEICDICVKSRMRNAWTVSLIAPAPSVYSGLRKTYASFLRRPAGRRGRMRGWEFSTKGGLTPGDAILTSRSRKRCKDPASRLTGIEGTAR